MRALVVYESLYGNTRKVAEAVGEGLRAVFDVAVLPVGDEASLTARDADLIVVGGPTYGHATSNRQSREMGAKDAPAEAKATSTGVPVGVREWVDSLPRTKTVTAAFDTRLNKPRLITGAASQGLTRRLRKRGYRVAEPASFLVEHGDGPLVAGEIERARLWGTALATEASKVAHGPRGT